ncbi:hypothetical protein [Paraburkholderia ferrariae]|uniref:hypothetical protein n=1 Tax=Paraburkholderia ferrariae TaxID=386056 RepID=UPI0005A841EE|nr:hypothetical protein [Paraburkholderia ferrariae]
MIKITITRVVSRLVLLALFAGVMAFNTINLLEAYGSGEPYYSRTTNIDKWSNPLPVLAVVDGIAVLIGVACFVLGKHSLKGRR